MDHPAIGIDLGTTNSCVSVWRNGLVEVIPDEWGNKIIPSVVYFGEDGIKVGEQARLMMGTKPKNTIYGTKRFMGKSYFDQDLQKCLKNIPFKVVDEKQRPRIKIETNNQISLYSPEDISAEILKKMKHIAENYLSTKINDAVITVPAYFGEAQRQATKDAGEIAGLNVLLLSAEPTAAAIAYEMQRKIENKENVLVYDFGGGTFDISVLTLIEKVLEVKATEGNPILGGHDLDDCLVGHILEKFKSKHKIDLKDNISTKARLRNACIQGKHKLLEEEQVKVKVEKIINNVDLEEDVTKESFEQLNMEYFEETLQYVAKALSAAKMTTADIKEIILIGGSTRIPKVQELVKKYFDKKEINMSINPDEAVSIGAARKGVEKLVLDVVPKTLGIEDHDGTMAPFIPRNRTIPTTETRFATTLEDYQDDVIIKILEGEAKKARDNTCLKTITFSNLPRMEAGQVNITITYDVDANGILTCRAESSVRPDPIIVRIDREKTTKSFLRNLSIEELDQRLQFARTSEDESYKTEALSGAKLRLEQYAKHVKNHCENEKNKHKIDEITSRSLIHQCNEILSWIQSEPAATKNDYDERLRDLKEDWKPCKDKVITGEFEMNTDDITRMFATQISTGLSGMAKSFVSAANMDVD